MSEEAFEYVPLYPIGGATSSATDMVKFMKAILNDGRYDGLQIIDSATLQFMESPAHRHHPLVNPMRYGFMDMSYNGVTIIGHGGDTFWFHSMMALFPEFNTGLFVSFNTDKGGEVYEGLLEQFTDRYFPKRPLRQAMKADKEFLERFSGAYRYNRYAHHDITAIASLFGDVIVTAADSTRLKIVSGGNVEYYIPTDKLAFREVHSSKVIAFKENEKGQITHMFIGDLAIMALDKVTGIRSSGIQNSIFLVVVLTSIIMLFYWPITGSANKER